MKSFTTITTLGRSDLETLIRRSHAFRELAGKGALEGDQLAGRTVANMFFEPSTRTRLSFELAARRLGAHVLTLDPPNSSVEKGESLRDTVLTVTAIGADILVVRHSEEGVPERVAEWSDRPVVNAGDGTNEHPTQALVDVVTIIRHFGEPDGLRMAIVGDISHSRVARSLIGVVPTLGIDVTLVGPDEWLPESTHIPATESIDDVLSEVDILYVLRVQTERGGIITDRFISGYRIDQSRASRLRDRAVIMHPGPLNRGVEIESDVADGPRSLVLDQVANGVPARMAVLEAVGRSS